VTRTNPRRRRSRPPARLAAVLVLGWALLALGLALASCAGFGHLFKQPRVELVEATVRGLSREGLDLTLGFNVQNPNGVRLPLGGIDYRVAVNGERLLAGSESQRVDIPAHGASQVVVPVTLRYDDFMRVLKSLKEHAKPLYDIDAEFRFAVPVVGTVRVPVHQRREIPLPDLRLHF
jgi:LEA14-like dessication related protein